MRDKYLDVAKGIGIILVVMVHSSVLSMQVDIWVNQFYMPMFFMVSGYLLGKYNKLDSLYRLKKSVTKFAVIYFGTCIGLLMIRVGMLFRQDTMSMINTRSIICVLWGRFYDPCNEWVTDEFFSGHLWFLTSMTISYILLYCVVNLMGKKKWRKVVAIVVLILIGQLARSTPILLPWCIDVAPVTTLFMLFGYWLGEKDKLNVPVSIKVVLIDVTCIGLFIFLHDVYDIHMKNYGTQQNILGIIFFVLVALSGSFLLIRISRYLTRIGLIGQALAYLGENSLSIFLWHILWIVLLGTYIVSLPIRNGLVKNFIFVLSIIVCSLLTQKIVRYTYSWIFDGKKH